MQHAAASMTRGLRVTDVSGQKEFTVGSIPTESTIGDLIQKMLEKMGLARNDSEGRPLHYRARLAREGRHLGAHELVRDALQEEDELSLHPSIDAG